MKEKNSNSNRGRDFKTEIEQWLERNPSGTRKDCAYELKTSEVTIGNYINKYKIPFKNSRTNNQNETLAKIKAWLKENPNGTRKDCAKDLNYSEYTIGKYVQENNLPFKLQNRNHKRNYEEEIINFIKNNENKITQIEMSKKLDINIATLRKYLRKIYKDGKKVTI